MIGLRRARAYAGEEMAANQTTAMSKLRIPSSSKTSESLADVPDPPGNG
jgi:hypothetical protein